MKKYLLSFIAVVMAISFSAFTAPAKKHIGNQALYWYLVNSDMATVDPANQLDPEPIEKAQAESLVTCKGNTSHDCARGFTQELSSSTTSAGQDQIKRNN